MTGTRVDASVAVLVLLVAALTVMMVVFLIWRSGYGRGWRASRTLPPTCPGCGYNLSGLSQSRCPECGSEYTLDQLWTEAILPPRRVPSTDKTTKSVSQGSQR